ncbi:MAG: SDR family oxidoreductase [Treponema sp.]|nr:SDR family oxidoreductase [Treponema sp.]
MDSKLAYNPFSLESHTILVTGASSGIGQGIAIECSKLGASVFITARNEERLSDTFKQLDTSFKQHHQMQICDLTDEKSVDLLAKALPQIDGLVNCAGIFQPLLFKFVHTEQLRSIMESNFNSAVLLTRAVFSLKKINKNGSIVFISSVNGTKITSPGSALYASSKAALCGFSKTLAVECAVRGIRSNTITPGMVDTHILDSGTITNEQLDEDRKKYPLGRYGKVEDIAHAAAYLLSDASCWMTGTDLLIDGGYTLL